MGMHLDLAAFADSDAELNKKIAYRKKLKMLSIVLVLAVVARIFIKNPPPPQPVVYTNQNFRALPGVLKNLSEADKQKFTPQQLAMMEEADRKAAMVKTTAGINLTGDKKIVAKGTVQSASAGFKTKIPEVKSWKLPEAQAATAKSAPKTTVFFSRGGIIQAESVTRKNAIVTIRLNSSMVFQIPATSVSKIMEKSETWEAPIPSNYLGNKNEN